MVKQLVTILELDDKKFKKSLDSDTKELKIFSAGATAVGAAIAFAAKQTANFQDHVNDVAKAVGATTREVSSLNVVAKLNGSSSEAMEAALNSLAGPTDKVAKKIEGLGINMKNADGSFKSSTQLLGGIAEKMAALKSPADKAYLATRIFGSGELVQSLDAVAGGFDEIAKQAERMGQLVSQDAANAAAKFNDDLDELALSAEGLNHTIMTSVIAFANQTGAIQAASAVVQGAIKYWVDLDQETKDIIITITAVTIGIGVMTGAVMVAGAAFAAVTAPVLIVAAALTAVAVVGLTVAENWEQMQNVVEPLGESFALLGRDLASVAKKVEDVIKPIGDAAKGVQNMSGYTDGAGKKVAILGTIVKFVMASIAVSVDSALTVFRLMIDTIKTSILAVRDLASAMAAVMAGQYSTAKDLATNAASDIVGLRDRLMNEMGALQKRAKEMQKDPVVLKADSKEVKEASEEVEKLSRSIQSANETKLKLTSYQSAVESMNKPFKELSDSIDNADAGLAELTFNIGNVISSVSDMASSAIAPVTKLVEAQVEKMNQALAKQNYSMDLFSKLRSKQMQQELDAFKASEDARIAKLKAVEDEKLKALEEGEKQRLALMEFYRNERKRADDAEYQAARDKKNQEFEAYKLSERAKFEFDLALLAERDLTEEERRVTKGVMEENWKAYLATLESDHLAEMTAFQDNYNADTEKKDTEFKEQMKVAEEQSTALKERTAKASADNLNSIQAQSQAQYEQMQKKKEEEEKLHQKAMALFNWRGQVSALEQTKSVQVAQTMAAAFAGVGQAMASPLSIATFGIAGVVLSGIIMAAASKAVSNIQRQRVMPPAELFMEDGGVGVLRGASHSRGGIKAELEHNEAVISASKTRKIEEFVDAGMNQKQPGPISVIFEKGSITGEKNFDERFMDKLGMMVVDRVRRMGVGVLVNA